MAVGVGSCIYGNGGCDQICIPRYGGGVECRCGPGYRLDINGRSCSGLQTRPSTHWAPDWEPGHRVVASWVSYVDRVRSGPVNVSDLYFDPGFEFYGVVRIYSARPTTYSQNCFFASFVARYLHAISIYLHFHCFKRKLLAAMSIDTVTSNVFFSASSAAHELKSTPRKQLVFESFIEISVQNTKLEILFFFES